MKNSLFQLDPTYVTSPATQQCHAQEPSQSEPSRPDRAEDSPTSTPVNTDSRPLEPLNTAPLPTTPTLEAGSERPTLMDQEPPTGEPPPTAAQVNTPAPVSATESPTVANTLNSGLAQPDPAYEVATGPLPSSGPEPSPPGSPEKGASSGKARGRGEADESTEDKTEVSNFEWLGRIRGILTGRISIALALAAGGLLAFYIYCQILSLLASLAALPRWLAIAAMVPLVALVAVVVFAMARLMLAYCRFRHNRQVRLGDIEQLERHTGIRHRCQQFGVCGQERLARAVLEEYVREYPQYRAKPARSKCPATVPSSNAAPDRDRTHLFSDEQLIQIERVRQRLADPAWIRNSHKWLDEYEKKFQPVLDRVAMDRMHDCAKWVGCKTAISPNSLVDTMITAYWGFVLLRDLCVIYNVRVGVFGTAALLWRVFFTAYLAGKLNDWDEPVDDAIETLLDGLLPEIGRKIAGKLTAKAGTGLANYYMVRRLGRQAINLLRPLAIQGR